MFDFCSIKNTVLDSDSNGSGTELSEVLETIEKQQFVSPVPLLEHQLRRDAGSQAARENQALLLRQMPHEILPDAESGRGGRNVVIRDQKQNLEEKLDAVINDPVNHPSHYTSSKIEVIEYILDHGFDYLLGNVVRYISRAGLKSKDNTTKDIIDDSTKSV